MGQDLFRRFHGERQAVGRLWYGLGTHTSGLSLLIRHLHRLFRRFVVFLYSRNLSHPIYPIFVRMAIVSPSLLSADFGNLQRDIEMLNASEAEWFHLDVMDGVFVPNISFGFPVMQAMAEHAEKPLDVHLMIVQPEKFIKEVKALGAKIMNVHYEACTHLHRVVGQIKEEGMMAGVTLNPHTPVSVLEEIIGDVDLVMLMSVNPGFGGQKFIEHTIDKTRRLRELIDRTGSSALIEIDGGVNRDTGKRLVEAGADALVAGSSVFRAEDPVAEVHALHIL